MTDAMQISSGGGAHQLSRTSVISKIAGLIAAAVVAWLLTVLFDLAPTVLSMARPTPYSPHPDQLRNVVTLYAVFGLPVALVFVLAAGYPAWRRWERLGRTHRRDAIWLGAISGLLLGLALGGVIFLNGVQMRLDPHSSANSWSYGYQMVSDGMPTALGWAFQIFDLALTTVTGAAAGLAAWQTAWLMEARRR